MLDKGFCPFSCNLIENFRFPNMPLDNDHNHHLHHHHHHHDHAAGLSPHHHHLNLVKLDSNCGNNTAFTPTEHHPNIDLVTTLRSELAALSYKKERLANELADAKTSLSVKEGECESLRTQTARQTALISSLQNRVQAAENREQSIQSRCDTTIQTIQREKRSTEERTEELLAKIKHLEDRLQNEEDQREQAHNQLNDFIKRLRICFGMDAYELGHLGEECVITRAEELIKELHRTKMKLNSTCDTLSSCENELLNLKSLSNIEKQRMSDQLESVSNRSHELEARCRQYERDLQIQRDRLGESELNLDKLKEELRGFESRCHRVQTNLNRVQNDRLEFLRCLANQLNLSEPCETLIKDKLRDLLSENKNINEQIQTLRDQLCCEHVKLKEEQETTQCRLKNEEAQKCELEDRLEQCHAEIHSLRKDQTCLSDFLQRLARTLQWSECSSSPAFGNYTNILAECLLERVERLVTIVENHHCHKSGGYQQHQHHHPSGNKSCCDHYHNSHTKLRREKSCHDIPTKESTNSLYNLQRKVRVLKELVQRRDLHLELLKRKLATFEDGARGKCLLQGEHDDAICRIKKANKLIDKLTEQLAASHSQIAEFRVQLAEAVEYKITALERARKIDDLTTQLCDLEEEKTKLLSEVNALKEKLKSLEESDQRRRRRDEALINSLRDDLKQSKTQLIDANHRLCQLQNFRTSVARTLHLRDLPETDLLQRLRALCSAHQEFTMLSKPYETASPIAERTCIRHDDPLLPSNHCHVSSYSITPEDIPAPTNHHGHNHNLRHNRLHNHTHGHHHPHRYH